MRMRDLLAGTATGALLALGLSGPAASQAVDPHAPGSAAGGVLAQAPGPAAAEPGEAEAPPGAVDPAAPDSAAGGLLAATPAAPAEGGDAGAARDEAKERPAGN